MNATQKTSAPFYDLLHFSRHFDLPVEEAIIAAKPLPGFVTFYDPGWSIIKLREAVANERTIFFPLTWYGNRPFANFDEAPRYRQLRMAAAPDSFDKPFPEQQALLPSDEEIPSARVVIMGMIIHFLATGERLFADHFVRSIDKISDSSRVFIGAFIFGGVRVDAYCGDYRSSGIGLASSRKF